MNYKTYGHPICSQTFHRIQAHDFAKHLNTSNN